MLMTPRPADAVLSFHTHPNLNLLPGPSGAPYDIANIDLFNAEPSFIISGPGVYKIDVYGSTFFLGSRPTVLGGQ